MAGFSAALAPPRSGEGFPACAPAWPGQDAPHEKFRGSKEPKWSLRGPGGPSCARLRAGFLRGDQ